MFGSRDLSPSEFVAHVAVLVGSSRRAPTPMYVPADDVGDKAALVCSTGRCPRVAVSGRSRVVLITET